MSEGNTAARPEAFKGTGAESVTNSVLEYFGPAVVGPVIGSLFIGSAPAARIVLFIILHLTLTMTFPLALWHLSKRQHSAHKLVDQAWYASSALLNAALPWVIRPEVRWSHYGLGLIFAAIAASDTLGVSLRPTRGWKPLLYIASASYAAFLITHGTWQVGVFCLAFGVHLAGGHEAVQKVVTHLHQQHHVSEILAATDPLTGLANRRGLSTYVEQAIEDDAGSLTVIAIDIDDFKQINDRFGHHGGDAALVHLSGFMQDSFRDGWIVARSGGDEFMCATTGDAGDADRLLRSVPSLICDDSLVPIRVSAGIATGAPSEALLADASAALRLSKRNGKHCVTRVDDELRAELAEVRRLGAQLSDAVQRREIEIWAQPIMHLTGPRAGDVHSYECLARWATPDGVSVPPSTFIPIIEDQRLTRELGETVISKAAEFLASLPPEVSVAVNVSATHFTSGAFIEFLHHTLTQHKLDAKRLTIEITESEDIPSQQAAWGIARQLQEMGVGLAIDDFGTGYASIERLIQFPCSQLKVDKTIVDHAASAGVRHLLAGFGAMANHTELDIVAEGVETVEQASLLKELEIPLGQGYLFGRPEPVQNILDRKVISRDFDIHDIVNVSLTSTRGET